MIGDDYANAPPAAALARRGLAAIVRGYSVYGDYGTDAPLRPIIDAVERGDIDAAIVWGPIAGYFAKRARVPLVVTPVEQAAGDPPLSFAIALGVRRPDTALRAALEQVLAKHGRELTAVLRRFDVPIAGM